MSPKFLRLARILRLPILVLAGLALAYGIWAAIIDSTGPNRLIVPLAVDQPGRATLDYDRGAGLRPEDSVSRDVTPSTDVEEVVFPVPRVALREIRFHPFAGAGGFTIGQPRLESASGRFIAKFPIMAIVARKEIASMNLDEKQWVGTTVAGATDPQLTFALGAPLRVGEPRIPWIEAVVLTVLALAAWRLKPRASANPGKTDA